MQYNIELNQKKSNNYDIFLLKSTDNDINLSSNSIENFSGESVSDALVQLKNEMPAISTVNVPTPTITVSDDGLITSQSVQQTGYVGTTTKVNTKQLSVVEQQSPTINISSSGMISSSASIGSGIAISKTTNNTYQIEMVDVGKPVNTISTGGKISATVTQEAGYVKGGTQTTTTYLATMNGRTITPSTTTQTISGGVLTLGTIHLLGDGNLIPSNIKKGVKIFNVTGTLEANTSITLQPLQLTIKNNLDNPYNSSFNPVVTVFYMTGPNISGSQEFTVGGSSAPRWDSYTVSRGNSTTISIPRPKVLYILATGIQYNNHYISVECSPSGAANSITYPFFDDNGTLINYSEGDDNAGGLVMLEMSKNYAAYTLTVNEYQY